MRIRAIAIFERVIHNCFVVDGTHPERPLLEVDAVLRPGDADDGPLLLPAPTFMALVGGPAAAEEPLRALDRAGRIVRHQGIAHIAFHVWSDEAAHLGAG